MEKKNNYIYIYIYIYFGEFYCTNREFVVSHTNTWGGKILEGKWEEKQSQPLIFWKLVIGSQSIKEIIITSL